MALLKPMRSCILFTASLAMRRGAVAVLGYAGGPGLGFRGQPLCRVDAVHEAQLSRLLGVDEAALEDQLLGLARVRCPRGWRSTPRMAGQEPGAPAPRRRRSMAEPRSSSRRRCSSRAPWRWSAWAGCAT